MKRTEYGETGFAGNLKTGPWSLIGRPSCARQEAGPQCSLPDQPVALVSASRHRACPGGFTAFALVRSCSALSSAEAVEPPGQARWRVMQQPVANAATLGCGSPASSSSGADRRNFAVLVPAYLLGSSISGEGLADDEVAEVGVALDE